MSLSIVPIGTTFLSLVLKRKKMPYRFDNIDIDILTIENYADHLPESLVLQITPFSHQNGSFDDAVLRRYVQMLKQFELEDPNSNMTLANRLRLAFKDMQPDMICSRFPNADLPLNAGFCCVAEYLIRSSQLIKCVTKMVSSLRNAVS